MLRQWIAISIRWFACMSRHAVSPTSPLQADVKVGVCGCAVLIAVPHGFAYDVGQSSLPAAGFVFGREVAENAESIGMEVKATQGTTSSNACKFAA